MIPQWLVAAFFVLTLFSCSGKKIYSYDPHWKTNAPVKRGYTLSTRIGIQDANQEPVESATSAFDEHTLYVASETQNLQAINRYTMQKKWSFSLQASSSGTVLLKDQTLYLGSNDGNFYAIDKEFGQMRWSYLTKAPVISKPFATDTQVFFTSMEDTIYCLDSKTGQWLWHYKRGSTQPTTVRGNSSPLVVQGVAYVGFSDGYLVALNSKDGNVIWEQKIHKGKKFLDVDSTPLLDGNTLYAASYDGEFYALDAKTGKIIWTIDLPSSREPILHANVIYLASNNGFIHAIHKGNGTPLWKFELDRGAPTGMVLHEHYLSFGSSQEYFYVLDVDQGGKLVYRFDAGLRSGFSSNPAFMQDKKEIMILSNFGNLHFFQFR